MLAMTEYVVRNDDSDAISPVIARVVAVAMGIAETTRSNLTIL
jgi:FlaG/FlaF family flagellin (archaellin)